MNQIETQTQTQTDATAPADALPAVTEHVVPQAPTRWIVPSLDVLQRDGAWRRTSSACPPPRSSARSARS